MTWLWILLAYLMVGVVIGGMMAIAHIVENQYSNDSLKKIFGKAILMFLVFVALWFPVGLIKLYKIYRENK